MPVFKHRFDSVEGYLHHRPPYLLVDRVISIEPRTIETVTRVEPSKFFLDGHFPGASIVPGALLQELTTQSAGILIAAEHNPMEKFNTQDPFFNEYALGVLVRVSHSRFRGFARPDDELTINVNLEAQAGQLFDFSGIVQAAGQTIMRNSFRLTNIRSELLYGADDAEKKPASVQALR